MYYTNQNTEGDIIIDLRISTDKGPQLNLNETNEICEDYYNRFSDSDKIKIKCISYSSFNTIPFYKIIDKWNYFDFFINNIDYLSAPYDYSNIYLYAIKYQGINSILINDKNSLLSFDNTFDSLKKFHIFKFVISLISPFFMIIICKINKLDINTNFIVMSIFIICIITYIIWLIFSVIYIENLMNNINKDFENYKNNFLWNLFMLIIMIIYFFYDLYISDFFSNMKCICENKKIEPPTTEIRNVCAICLSDESTYCFIPCGHKCICQNCYQKRGNQLNKCIICNQNCNGIIRIY